MNDELENLGWGDTLNTQQMPQMPNAKPKLKDRIKKLLAKPWTKSVLISLIIVLVGLGTSYGAYYQQKQANKKKADTTVISEATVNNNSTASSDTPASSDQTTTQTSPSGTTSTGSTTTKPSNGSTSNSSSNSSSGTNNTSVQTKTINSGATELKQKTSSNSKCNALAPDDWAIVADQYGMEAGITSPDLTAFASWSVPWSLNSMLAWAGHPELAQEENFLKSSLCVTNFADRNGVGSLEDCGNGGDYRNVSLGSASSLPGGYYSRDYSLTNNGMHKELQGILIYKNFSSGDVILYLLRMGSTVKSSWSSKGAIAVSSAISIACTVDSTGSALGSGVNRSSSDSEITLSDKWEEAIMGYENVYNPATGQHWEAPTSSYWDTGPQGAGYYYQNGNDLTKLNRGFGT
ncbi:MAG: hypothetical protein ACD_58C00096G0006 [uncultured bacterium]|nr:MAG: hypothetical protein ACD_58C00096G0006 [uncultured bacterium]